MVTRTGLCFRLLSGKCLGDGKVGKVFSHHLSKDDYGSDGDKKVVDCCSRCHKAIHQDLRERNACPLSVAETARLSDNSYERRTKRYIHFFETMMPNVQLIENIVYNTVTGHVLAIGHFHACNAGHALKYIDI